MGIGCCISFFQFSLNIRILGAIVTPISTLVLVFAFCLPKPDIVISQQFQSIWVSVHVITSFIGNGAFALAASVVQVGTGIVGYVVIVVCQVGHTQINI
jgi:hypothetical protein